MSFMRESAKQFILIKAAREIRCEIEKAGQDTLKTLAYSGQSIVTCYLNGCSPKEKARYRRDLNALLQMGITGDMLLEELTRQLPELSPIMGRMKGYKEKELQNLEAFLKGG